MEPATLWLMGTHLLLVLVLLASGLPLWLGKVPPNHFVGFRTPRTLSDPRVWYPVNAMAGRALALSGVVGLLLVLFGWLLPTLAVPALTATGLVVLGSVLWAFVRASAYVGDLDAGRIGTESEQSAEGEPADGATTRRSAAERQRQTE